MYKSPKRNKKISRGPKGKKLMSIFRVFRFGTRRSNKYYRIIVFFFCAKKSWNLDCFSPSLVALASAWPLLSVPACRLPALACRLPLTGPCLLTIGLFWRKYRVKTKLRGTKIFLRNFYVESKENIKHYFKPLLWLIFY